MLVVEDDYSETMEPCYSCCATGLCTKIGKAIVGKVYTNMLAEFPGLEIWHGEPNEMLYFKFEGGGRGTVMPMRTK